LFENGTQRLCPDLHLNLRGVVLCATLSLISAACGRSGDDRSAPSTVTIGTTYDADEWFLSPNWDVPAQHLVFLPLARLNEKGELEGRLATRWEHSPDRRHWTIYLRSDVRWHDGVPVTAHDIKFTMDLSSSREVLLAARDYTITVLDDTTYTVDYHGPGRDAVDEWRVYYPRHLLQDVDPSKLLEDEFWIHPVGNGPYRYVRHVPKTMIELEANPDYYAGRPMIERVIWKLGTSAVQELLAGNVDAIEWIDRLSVLRLRDDRRFHTYYDVTPGTAYALVWNHRLPKFRDAQVRRALTMAINRRELHRVLNLPDDLPIFEAQPTNRQYRRGEIPEPLPYDPEGARRLLTEAGWRDADGDGVRERAGQAFTFTVIVGGRQTEQQAAVYLQDQLRRVGIRMEIQQLSSVWVRLQAGDFEAVIERMFRSIDSKRWGMRRYLGSGGMVGYRNREAHALLEAASATADPDSLDAIYAELAVIFQADPPVTYLYPRVATNIVHRRIRGLASPFRANIAEYMHELWIEPVQSSSATR